MPHTVPLPDTASRKPGFCAARFCRNDAKQVPSAKAGVPAAGASESPHRTDQPRPFSRSRRIGFGRPTVCWLCLSALVLGIVQGAGAADRPGDSPASDVQMGPDQQAATPLPAAFDQPADARLLPAPYPDLVGIGGIEDPRYQGTGYFLETEYGRYVYRHDDAYLSVLGGGSNPTAGPLARLTKKSYDFRVGSVHPFLHGDLPVAVHNRYTVLQLQVGLAVSYWYSNWDTKSDIDVVQGAEAFRIDELQTSLWGLGPDVRLLFPPSSGGYRLFVGARFEGLGGQANPDPIRLGGPTPGNRVLPAKPTADVGQTDEIWGLRGEWSAGLMAPSGLSVFGSVGLSKLRSKVITDNELNSDLFSWAVHVGIPTELICDGTRACWSWLGY